MNRPAAPVEPRPRPSAPWPWILLGGLIMTAATPPSWWPGAELLMLPGLAIWFALVTAERRPVLASYWLGALHVAAFSWSLRHVTWFGWIAVGALGGCYYAAVALATRTAFRPDRAHRPVAAFALAVAGCCVLRAEMPGIGYPHGQPIHAFWAWPQWLGAVRLGGEVLGNALLAALAAASVQLVRAWRLAVPTLPRARATFASVAVVGAVATFMFAPSPRGERGATVAIAAIEPGYHSLDAFADVENASRAAYQRRWLELCRTRLVAPTEAVAGRGVASPPALVLWPESSVPWSVRRSVDGEPSFEAMRGAFALQPSVRVLLGAAIEHREGGFTPAAVLVGADGRYLGHHEKQRLVPGGESLPLVDWLPAGLAAAVRDFAATNVGIPDARPGRALPPLRLEPTNGSREPGFGFAGLICYDNAFPEVVADAVGAGAQFLAVLSNEAWYRGGAEREQLVAITVLLAIATETPIVRCTSDGLSMAVDGDGSVLATLAPAPAPQPAARVLRVDLPLGTGRLSPMAWSHRWLSLLAAVWLAIVLAHLALMWGKVLRSRRFLSAAVGARGSGDPRGGS